MNPTFEAPGSKRLKPLHKELLSNVAFNFNMRHYIVGDREVQAWAKVGCC